MTPDQEHKARIKKYFSAITRYNNAYIRESVLNKQRNAGRISPINLGYQRKYESDISRLLNRISAKEWRTAASEYGGQNKGFAEFRKNKASSFDISARVSEIRNQLDSQIDLAMRVNEGKGLSEKDMVNETRKLLRNPNKLQMIARQQLGNRRKLKYDKGDYKKVEQNIQRLISNEATDYYRASFLNQIAGDPKVKGIEIFLSPEHKVTDICDILAGYYPKDFYYSKWHTGCKCGIRTIITGKEITNVPRNFKAWIIGNEERVLNAKNLPEWISMNGKYL